MEGLLRLKQLYKAVQSAIDKIIGSAITHGSIGIPVRESTVDVLYRPPRPGARAASRERVTSDISPRYVTPKRRARGVPCPTFVLRGPRAATRSSRDTTASTLEALARSGLGLAAAPGVGGWGDRAPAWSTGVVTATLRRSNAQPQAAPGVGSAGT